MPCKVDPVLKIDKTFFGCLDICVWRGILGAWIIVYEGGGVSWMPGYMCMKGEGYPGCLDICVWSGRGILGAWIFMYEGGGVSWVPGYICMKGEGYPGCLDIYVWRGRGGTQNRKCLQRSNWTSIMWHVTPVSLTLKTK